MSECIDCKIQVKLPGAIVSNGNIIISIDTARKLYDSLQELFKPEEIANKPEEIDDKKLKEVSKLQEVIDTYNKEKNKQKFIPMKEPKVDWSNPVMMYGIQNP